MVAIYICGCLMQIIGMLVALGGVGKIYRMTQPGRHITPDLARGLYDSLLRMVCRRRESQQIHLARATLRIGSALSARLTTSPRDPGVDASVDEQVAYLRRFSEMLSHELDVVDQRVSKEVRRLNEVDRELDLKASRNAEEVSQSISTITTVLWGSNGEAIRATAIGILITLTGTVLAAIGSLAM